MDLQPLQKYVLGLCAYDDVGLWRVFARVNPEKRRVFPVPSEIRATAPDAGSVENFADSFASVALGKRRKEISPTRARIVQFYVDFQVSYFQ